MKSNTGLLFLMFVPGLNGIALASRAQANLFSKLQARSP
jgi:hypothetical protein